MNCIFCKIVKGDAPCYKIYEDNDAIAFLSIANDYYGHTLVVPKKHCENILDCPSEVLTTVMRAAQNISKHYTEKLGFDGVNVFINNGASADQVVFHLHVHIVPRKAENTHIWGAKIERDFKEEQKFLKLNPKF